MGNVVDFAAAAWPLVLVIGVAAVFIRGARGPRAHGVRSRGDYARDAARQEGRQELRGRRDVDFDGGGGGGGDGGAGGGSSGD